MVKLRWNPEIIGIGLNGDIFPMVRHRLSVLKSAGVRTVGFEPTFHLDGEALAILEMVANEHGTTPATREKLQQVKRALQHSAPQPTFSALQEMAKKMGFRVYELRSKTLTRAVQRFIWRNLRDKLEKGMKLSLNNGDRLRVELAHVANDAHMEYPSSKLLLSDHTRVLIREAKKLEPEAIFISAVHAPPLIRAIKVPKNKQTWITSNYVMHHPESRTERQAVLPLMRSLKEYERVRRRVEAEQKRRREMRRRKP